MSGEKSERKPAFYVCTDCKGRRQITIPFDGVWLTACPKCGRTDLIPVWDGRGDPQRPRDMSSIPHPDYDDYEALLDTLRTARMTLKSYECGNASPELAEEVGAFCDAAIAKATEGRA